MKKRGPPTKPKPKVVSAAAPSVPASSWVEHVGPLLAIAAVVLIGYYQVAWHNYVAWDDHLYVMCHEPGEAPNIRVASGLSWDNVYWAFTTDLAAASRETTGSRGSSSSGIAVSVI